MWRGTAGEVEAGRDNLSSTAGETPCCGLTYFDKNVVLRRLDMFWTSILRRHAIAVVVCSFFFEMEYCLLSVANTQLVVVRPKGGRYSYAVTWQCSTS